MRRLVTLAALAVLTAAGAARAQTAPADEPPAAYPADDLRSLPTARGLPVLVRTGLVFLTLDSFDENAGTFAGTTDLRLVWTDPRLQFPASAGPRGYKEYRGAAAEPEIARLWTPQLRIVNRLGEPTQRERRLRIFPDGTVEVLERTAAVYSTPVDVSRFPFDRQPLQVAMVVRETTAEEVDLVHRREDVEFTRVASDAALDGWRPGLANLRRHLVRGWNGDRYAAATVVLEVERAGGISVATIFIPLFASMLIPFLALWMNRPAEDGFAVEAFELANVVIGGLFAVIALSFTISSSYPAVAATDNTVTRLIALNYVALAVSLLVIVAFYRYRAAARVLGRCFQEQLFQYACWAIPFLCLATGAAIVLAAAA